jgi:hypothetical protein
MACSNEDRGRSRRPGAEDRGWSHRSGTRWLGDREIGWRCVRSTPCTWRRGAQVSWLNLKTKVDGLSVVWPQNHWDGFSSVWASKPMAMVCEWFGFKTTRTIFIGLALKPVATIFTGLASNPVATVSSGLASKPAAPPAREVRWDGQPHLPETYDGTINPTCQRSTMGRSTPPSSCRSTPPPSSQQAGMRLSWPTTSP